MQVSVNYAMRLQRTFFIYFLLVTFFLSVGTRSQTTTNSTHGFTAGSCIMGGDGFPLLVDGKPVIVPGYGMCKPGFMCPNSVPEDESTWPRYCPPTRKCQKLLNDHKFCPPQGTYEPYVCPRGKHCPTGKEELKCPKGYFCPAGTYKPHKCNLLTYCPEGTKIPYDYSSVFALGLMNIFAVLLWIILTHRRRALRDRANEARKKLMEKEPNEEEIAVALEREAEENRRRAQECLELTHSRRVSEISLSMSMKQKSSNFDGCGILLAPDAFINESSDKKLNDKKKKTDKSGFSTPKLHQVSHGSTNESLDHSNTNLNVKNEKGETSVTMPNTGQKKDTLGAPTRKLIEMLYENDRAILARGIERNREGMQPLHITFDNLSVAIDKGKRLLLRGVTGSIRPGRVTAIMGPTGAGKTVFMTTLLGKGEPSWRLSGTLAVNESAQNLTPYKHMVGYVPQDDILHAELTVFENVWYSAKLRLSTKWTDEERLIYVAAAIRATGIQNGMHTLVGPGDIGSGVNRKCVCLAVELAAAPAAIFLDEPTTGLDAATALQSCALLKNIAVASNLTVAMVIHQPRVEIWDELDELLLIAPGGRTVYQGPQKGAQSFFQKNIGISFGNTNPADVVIDCIANFQAACEEAWKSHLEREEVKKGQDKSAELMMNRSNKANNSSEGFGNSGGEHSEKRNNDHGSGNSLRMNTGRMHGDEASRRPAPHSNPGFFAQICFFYSRSLIKQMYHIRNILLSVLMSIICVSLMAVAALREPGIGLLVKPYSLMTPKMNVYNVGMLCMYYMLAISTSTSSTALRVICNDRVVIWKEISTGRMNVLAFFIGVTLGEMIRLMLTAIHFATVAYFMWNPVLSFWWIFFFIALAIVCNDGQSAAIGLLFPASYGSLLVTVVGCLVSLLNGFTKVPFLYHISYTFYYSEGILNRYVRYQDNIFDSEGYMNGFDYKLDRFAIDIICVIGILIIYRIIGYLLLIGTHRNKQR